MSLFYKRIRMLFVAVIIIIANATVFAQEAELAEDDIEDTDNRKIVLIFPLTDNSDQKIYGSSDAYRYLIFKSLYTFIGVVPTIKVPDEQILQSTPVNQSSLSTLSDEFNAEYIVFGSIKLIGKKNEPNAVIELKIWSRIDSKIIVQDYTSPVDYTLFDTIDEMIEKLTVNVLKSKLQFAYIRFNDFELGEQKSLKIFINDKLIADVTNNNFSENIRVLADNNYKIRIMNQDDLEIYKINSFVKPGQFTNISFSATKIINMELVKQRARKRVAINNMYFKGGRYLAVIDRGSVVGVQLNDIYALWVPRYRYVFRERKYKKVGYRPAGTMWVVETNEYNSLTRIKFRRFTIFGKKGQKFIVREGKGLYHSNLGYGFNSMELAPFNIGYVTTYYSIGGTNTGYTGQAQFSVNFSGAIAKSEFFRYQFGVNVAIPPESETEKLYAGTGAGTGVGTGVGVSAGLQMQLLVFPLGGLYNKNKTTIPHWVFTDVGAGLKINYSIGQTYPYIYADIGFKNSRWAWFSVGADFNFVPGIEMKIGLRINAGLVAFRF